MCMHWLFLTFTYNVPHFCCWKLVNVHRGLIDSTAESANYMSTHDNHVVGVMSHCESTNPFLNVCMCAHVVSFKQLIRGSNCTSPYTRPRMFLLAFLETNPCPTLYPTLVSRNN